MGNLVARKGNLLSKGNPSGWTYSETVADGVTSNPVKIKPNGKGVYAISVGLIAGANTGKIQFTLDADEAIDAGTAYWFDWDEGNCTGDTVDPSVAPVSALRCVSISGEVTWKILI